MSNKGSPSRKYTPKEPLLPPVYQKARLMVKQIIASTKKATREIKYDYIAETVNQGMKLMEIVTVAHLMKDRVEKKKLIEKALLEMNHIRIKIRIIHDIGCLSNKGFAAIIDYESDILYQLIA